MAEGLEEEAEAPPKTANQIKAEAERKERRKASSATNKKKKRVKAGEERKAKRAAQELEDGVKNAQEVLGKEGFLSGQSGD